MLALAFAFFGYMGDKRVLVGINDAMPMVDTEDAGPRGYVILGPHADWSSAPVKITLDGSSEYAVVSETYDFMARGLALAAGSTDATVTCKDGSTVECVINVETVW